ncbi:NAD(P)H-hydrate epimerase [bacterium]|nr:NAD(P)H-hydrate epimerase [bacterium]
MESDVRPTRSDSPVKSRVRLRPMSRAEFREIDRYAAETLGLPTMVLMENAGRGAAETLARAIGPGKSEAHIPLDLPQVVIICGAGNNGGDGAVLARHLEAMGLARVKVIWTVHPEELRGDAPAQYRILAAAATDQASGVDPAEADSILSGADWIVDGIFGTGLSRPLAPGEPATLWVEAIDRSGKPVLALDLPSGMDADTGTALGVAVRATITASFVAPKLGFAAPGANALTGVVEIVDIGVPRSMLKPFEVQ